MYLNTIYNLAIRILIAWIPSKIAMLIFAIAKHMKGGKFLTLTMMGVSKYLNGWSILWHLNLLIFGLTGCNFDLITLILPDFSEDYINVLNDIMMSVYLSMVSLMLFCIGFTFITLYLKRYINKYYNVVDTNNISDFIDKINYVLVFIVPRLTLFNISTAIIHSTLIILIELISQFID